MPVTPTALAEIERLGTTLERFSELVDVYQELAFRRDAADLSGRADLLARAAAALRRAAQQPAGRHRRLEAGPQPGSEQPRDGGAGRRGARSALRRDRRQRQPGQDLQLEAAEADAPAARKRALFRIAGLEEKALGDTQAAVATLRAILGEPSRRTRRR